MYVPNHEFLAWDHLNFFFSDLSIKYVYGFHQNSNEIADSLCFVRSFPLYGCPCALQFFLCACVCTVSEFVGGTFQCSQPSEKLHGIQPESSRADREQIKCRNNDFACHHIGFTDLLFNDDIFYSLLILRFSFICNSKSRCCFTFSLTVYKI